MFDVFDIKLFGIVIDHIFPIFLSIFQPGYAIKSIMIHPHGFSSLVVIHTPPCITRMISSIEIGLNPIISTLTLIVFWSGLKNGYLSGKLL